MKRSYWLVKSEPNAYSFDRLVKDGSTVWDGVRNFQARNNLRAMKKGDLVFFYHSGEGKEIVGLARVTREAYQDPTTDEDWSVVDLVPVKPLKEPVSLARIKAHPTLKNMELAKRPRLSVSAVTEEEFETILKESGTKV